jgi:hypothetical protein
MPFSRARRGSPTEQSLPWRSHDFAFSERIRVHATPCQTGEDLGAQARRRESANESCAPHRLLGDRPALPGQLSSLFGQGVATLIHDVSDMADGSVTQARIEAQRQVASGASPTEATRRAIPVHFLENTPRRNFRRKRRADLSMDSPCSRTTVAM